MVDQIKDKYSKLVFNLSKDEIIEIARHYQVDHTTSQNRENIMAAIFQADQNIADKNFKYYFLINAQNKLEFIKSTKILDYSVFPERPSTSNRKIDFEKLQSLITKVEPPKVNSPVVPESQNPTTPPPLEATTNLDNNSKEQIFTDNKISRSQSLQLVQEKPTKTDDMSEIVKVFEKVLNKEKSEKKLPAAHNILGVKLKYEQSRGIDSFLSLIDTFASTYNITDPSEKVKIALLALDNSDHGLTVKQILSKADCEDWDLFRSKLQSLLGRDCHSYREEFDNWSNSTDPPTLAIARLITIFKFTFDPPKESLTEEDERRIIRKFIKAQENPMIKGFLLAEQDKLDLKTLGQRTQHLLRAFNVKSDPFFAVNNIVPGQEDITDDQNHNLINRDKSNNSGRPYRPPNLKRGQFRSFNNRPRDFQNRGYQRRNNSYNYSNPRSVNRRQNRNQDVFDYRKLQGYCIADLTSECHYKDCRYKHSSEGSPVPESVRLAAANFLTNSKTEQKKT